MTDTPSSPAWRGLAIGFVIGGVAMAAVWAVLHVAGVGNDPAVLIAFAVVMVGSLALSTRAKRRRSQPWSGRQPGEGPAATDPGELAEHRDPAAPCCIG